MTVTADAGSTEHLVRSLLERHQDGFVMALGVEGLAVPVPDGLPLTTQRVAAGRSVLDIVEPSQRRQVIEAWEQTRAAGAARTQVRLAGVDDDVLVHLLDARDLHGVYLAFLSPVAGGDLPIAVASAEEPVATLPRVAVVSKDELAVFVAVDAATTGMLGWSAADLLGCRALDLVHPDDQDRAIENWLDLLERPESQERVRLRYLTSAGTYRWLEITNHNRLRRPQGDVVAEMIDITEEVAAVEALAASEQLLRRLAETVPVGLAQVDRARRITYANDRLAELVGGHGTDVAERFAGAAPADAAVLATTIDEVLADGLDRDLECAFAAPDGGDDPVLTSVSVRALADGGGRPNGAIICISDITESVRQRDELAERARRDPLTGGHNRLGLHLELELLLADPERRTAVLFVDLDDFKQVNDDHGHHTGDELLRVVVRRLSSAMRPGDTVARLGGDEFVVVCPDAEPDQVGELAQRADLALRSPMVLDGEVVPLRASIGLAHAVGGTTPDQVLAAADAAMYRAKHDRRAGGAGHPVAVAADDPAA